MLVLYDDTAPRSRSLSWLRADRTAQLTPDSSQRTKLAPLRRTRRPAASFYRISTITSAQGACAQRSTMARVPSNGIPSSLTQPTASRHKPSSGGTHDAHTRRIQEQPTTTRTHIHGNGDPASRRALWLHHPCSSRRLRLALAGPLVPPSPRSGRVAGPLSGGRWGMRYLRVRYPVRA
jgi:hypothetical protein